MKIALVGNGRTGSTLPPLAAERGHTVTIFNSTRPLTVDALAGHDVAVAFVTGDVFLSLVETLIESRISVVTGATGWQPPPDLHQRILAAGSSWVWGTNFSLGMLLIREMIGIVSGADRFLPGSAFHLHEIHHAQKKDAPSGTALAWKTWLAKPVEITYERKGDVVGEHMLRLDAEAESITLTHIAHDRSLFTRGALRVAESVCQGNIPRGLHRLEGISSLIT